LATPIEIAITVKEKVKQRIPILGRSDNKKIRRDLMSDMTPEKDTQVTLSRMEVTAGVHNVRKHPRNRMITPSKARPKDILAYGSIVMAAGYGNCFELACAAAFCMSQGPGKELGCDLVCYTGGGDHVFLAIAQPLQGNDGYYPRSFAEWDAGAAICDAWADIACPARNYPERWRARMQNWEIMGIQLGSVLPTNAIWADLVDQPKRSFFFT
jgi:hypothetical protein